MPKALGGIRICDFTGQLAGAGATRFLAAMGAEVIRIEDPVNSGRWDILRGGSPWVDQRRGINLGGSFNNHNVEKLGITLNLRTERGKRLLEQLISVSDAVTENFAGGVLDRLGFSYDRMRAIKPDIIYVSNCGFGHEGTKNAFKTWGPTVQAVSGLTQNSGLPGLEPAGWGYSYMDHTGGYMMATAVLMALYHRAITGEGQRVDYSTIESAIALNGPVLLDATVNGRPFRRAGQPDTNHSDSPRMAPHYIYRSKGEDRWVAIACRDDDDWRRMKSVLDRDWANDERFMTLDDRLRNQAELDRLIESWTLDRTNKDAAESLTSAGVPAAEVLLPVERIDESAMTDAWDLWPEVRHTEMGRVRVDGYPIHLSKSDWQISHGAPCLGEHNNFVYGAILGLSSNEISELESEGVI